jgi:hypothetical protein
LTYRLHKMGFISEWNYRIFNIQLRQNYGNDEPNGVQREKSHTWVSILQGLWREGRTIDHIATELHLPPSEVRGILFGLTASPTAQGVTGAISRPQLIN